MSSRWLSFCCALWELWLLHVQVSAPTWEAMRRCIWQLESLHLYPNPWPGRKTDVAGIPKTPFKLGVPVQSCLCYVMLCDTRANTAALSLLHGGDRLPSAPCAGAGAPDSENAGDAIAILAPLFLRLGVAANPASSTFASWAAINAGMALAVMVSLAKAWHTGCRPGHLQPRRKPSGQTSCPWPPTSRPRQSSSGSGPGAKQHETSASTAIITQVENKRHSQTSMARCCMNASAPPTWTSLVYLPSANPSSL